MIDDIASAEADKAVVASEATESIQLEYDGRSMGWFEIESAVELLVDSKPSDDTATESGKKIKGNSLSLTSVGLTTSLTEQLIRLIRDKQEWDSITLTNLAGDRTLSSDLLTACTSHPSTRSITWRGHIVDGIHGNSIQEPTDLPTINALLFGLKYASHLTKLKAIGLVLDVNTTNLLSRALVRNQTLLDLDLSGAIFLSETNANQTGRGNENHRGTKNMAVQTLSFGLRFNRTIESLSLDMCKDLEDEDIACLINAVNSDDTVLRHLSIQETACFDQGMSSVAVMLQENVIETLNMSYLVRRTRKTPEKEEEAKEEETRQEDKEETELPTEDEALSETVETNPDEEAGGEAKTANAGDSEQEKEQKNKTEPSKDLQAKKVEDEQERQQVQNTSLKVLSMAGNFLDDEYLESLLGIFPSQAGGKDDQPFSQLEELNILGNRFSNYGIKYVLKRLPRFPYLQRLYLGYQRAPPSYGPTFLPKEMLSRMMTTDPTISDRNAQFSPASLRKEFIAAVSEHPRNFRLTDVNIMALSNEDRSTAEIIRHYMMLNTGGRKLLASYVQSNSASNGEASPSSVPLGLWSLVLDRANRLHDGKTTDTDNDRFHAGDVIFCLLHGPMFFENLDRRPLQG